jgi:hypothetical protein
MTCRIVGRVIFGEKPSLMQECLGEMGRSERLLAVPPIVIQLRPQLFEQRGVLRSGGFSQKLVNDRYDSDVFREGASITGKRGISALTWFCL